MADKIINFFPPRYTHYIEPFSGGFSIGLSEERPGVEEVYNDLEKNTYTLFKVIQDEELYPQLKEKMNLTPYSEKLHQDAKKALKTEMSMVERAYNFMYWSRTARNGMGDFATMAVPRMGIAKGVRSYLSSIENLPNLHKRMSKVTVLNKDGIEVINQYKTIPTALLYCDPPYEHSTRSSVRYKVDMNKQNQIRFLEAIKDATAFVAISGYDNPLYNEVLGDKWQRIDFKINTTTAIANVPKTKIESLWMNYGEIELN